MLKKAMFPGKYIQGRNALAELPSLVTRFGGRGLILASPSAHKTILFDRNMEAAKTVLPVERFNGECCEKELSRLATILQEQQVDVLVGMGGGKAIDTAKIAADRANLPVLVVPTIASTDAPCSGCAVLYSEHGVFECVCYQKSNPAAVLVDMDIIAHAPVRFLVAGMGDALATWFEAKSCDNTQSPNECGGLSTLTGLNLARLCYDTLLNYGELAKIAAERQIITPALEHIVEANILLSGIGFESGGLASAHSLHNGFTALKETHAYYHGEKVAFGVLAGLQLTDASPKDTIAVFSFCEAVGLPTSLADIGLQSCDRDRLMAVAEKACAPDEGIHHEAGKMTPEKVLQAILAADAIGENRKKAARAAPPRHRDSPQRFLARLGIRHGKSCAAGGPAAHRDRGFRFYLP
ncbi:MAG: glycerol dehydrogenase [Deltaproteobacteria bacterium]|nr:glycerol dehydrogenase [Deltaproteobacteria bacterium]